MKISDSLAPRHKFGNGKSDEISTASAMMLLVLIDRLSIKKVVWRCAISESRTCRFSITSSKSRQASSVDWFKMMTTITHFHNTIKTSSKLWLQFLCVAGILITHETLPPAHGKHCHELNSSQSQDRLWIKDSKNVYDNRNRLPLSSNSQKKHLLLLDLQSLFLILCSCQAKFCGCY